MSIKLQNPNQTLPSFKPLHNQFGKELSFGAEVVGIDLSKSLSSQQWETLMTGFEKHSLLLFKNQQLTPEMQLNFLTSFPHDIQAVKEGRNIAPFYKKLPGYPPLLSLHGYGSFTHYGHEFTLPAGEVFKYSHVWHTDFNSISDTPPVVSAMYAVVVPKKGGETLFCSSIKAYELLIPELQKQALEMKVCYCPTMNFKVEPQGRRRIDDVEASMKNFNPPEVGRIQPVVIQTKKGKNALFLSVHSAGKIEGMEAKPSQELIEKFLTPGTQPEHIFSLKWEVGDFAIWNNREILHTGTPWHVYENEQRLMHIFFLDSTEKVTPAS
ncbi:MULTISPECIES: TauD/TfdA family dioxygenase [Okeania]|uniref:TauD/TfdA family dioxygenase n=1 Tax=Okeania hirsuta TaxID=1458930 RepID=A0A3N6QJV1_9CYAN|nr:MULTISPECIES: TauD/TfdA family dioxygenase [Okeania]NES88006.1 TauD/TfdA family dioxygenase [Okeania sp. SIO2B9]NET77607.1 TauD/TfdA family dioxygenase [Okeania sp. SIO1F9]RQH43065.1 TauD/TfdA family dioxygenase [Okeania hirsuta]